MKGLGVIVAKNILTNGLLLCIIKGEFVCPLMDW